MKNKEKFLIAIDLDGTLLTDQKAISPLTRDFFNGLGKEGHHIVIATGRPLRAAYDYQQQLGVSAPIVSYNGALASYPDSKTFKKRTITFDKAVIEKIVGLIPQELITNLMIETETHIYLLHEDEDLNRFFWNDRERVSYGDPFLLLEENPLTLIFRFGDGLSDEQKAVIEKIVTTNSEYGLRFWHYSGFAELYRNDGTKKDALIHVARELNIPHENIIACGDAENDTEMLQWAFHSVWMKNGVESVKPHAKYITEEDNNNDGLVTTINKIIR